MSEEKLDSAKYRKKRSMEPLLELPDFVTDAPPPAMSATLDAGFRDVPLVDPDGEAVAEEEELGGRPSLSSLARQADTATLQAWRTTLDGGAGIKKGLKTGLDSNALLASMMTLDNRLSRSESGSGGKPSGPRGASYYAAALADIRGGIKKGLQKGREEEGEERDAKARARRTSSSSSSSDDIEALAAKACALASTPIPDYADTFARKDQKYNTKKYRDKDFQRASREDDDPNSIRLAGKTSNILSEFQDYLEVIESQPSKASILEYKPIRVMTKTGPPGEERRGVVLTEWNWEDKFSDRPNYKRRSSRDRNLYTDDKSTNTISVGDNSGLSSSGDGDSAGSPGDEKKRYRYAHPSLHSKKFKVGALWVIVSMVLLGAFIGITSSGHKEDFEREYMDRVQGVKVRPAPNVTPSGVQQGDAQKDGQGDTAPSNKESTGDSAPSVIAAATPLDAAPGDAPQVDAQKGDAQKGGGLQYQDEELVYQATIEKYHLKGYNRAAGWEGRTYHEAYEFCAEKHRGICPFDAVCPLGPGTKPFGGYVYGSEKTWVPISDGSNEWVNLSKEGPCVKYSFMYQHQPEWGATGEGSEGLTRAIMCCEFGVGDETSSGQTPPAPSPSNEPVPALAHPTTTSLESSHNYQLTAEMSAAYRAAVEKYHPHGYDRAAGWEGATYREAGKFCQGKGGVMCPFDAVCPLGPGSLPFGGYRDGTEKAWAPVSDNSNEWVNLSDEGPCVNYSSVYEHLPLWGETGEGSEGLTRTIMCCEVGVEESSGQTLPAPSPSNKPVPAPAHPTTESAHKYQLTEEMTVAYLAAVEKYHPRGYDRAAGWGGTTYQEAVEFCQGERRVLCPFDAVCPLGLGSLPSRGHLDGAEKAWVPVSDWSNEWVNLSEKGLCIKYSSMYEHLPLWSETGEGSEGLTHTIMCCEVGIEESSGQTSPAPSNEPVPAPVHPKTESAPKYQLTAEMTAVYRAAVDKYHPHGYNRATGWEGATPQEAVEFCEAEHRVLCPFYAVCPLGLGSLPFGGYLDGATSWVPIADAANDWVNLGDDGPCTMYSDTRVRPPEWGATGEGGEAGHVVCCEGDRGEGPALIASPAPSPSPTPAPTPPKATTSESIAANVVAPEWYDRSSGWTGRTYDEAFSFCARQGPGYELCPYESYCLFSNGVPSGGLREERPGGTWAPIGDSFNDWVQVGGNDPCVRYSTVHSSHPYWGLTGAGSEDLTRHIACCLMGNLGEGTASSAVASANMGVANENTSSSGTPEEDSTSEVAATYNIGSSLDYPAIIEKYAPKWYHRYDGTEDEWFGNSYIDAIVHCARQNSSIPCPFEAYCPNGPGSTPFLGSPVTQHAQGDVWAPIMDIPNGWVNVGPSSDSCKLYNSLHIHPPLWGLVGHRSEEEGSQPGEGNFKDMTAHIMCCREPPEGTHWPLPEGLGSAFQTSVPAGPVPAANTKFEQDILDKKHPLWFSRDHGYYGTTHEEAAGFCKNVGDMVLCPAETYCPEGNKDPDRPLFFQNPAFEEEQWAPVATTNTSSNERWLLIGKVDGDSRSTCSTFGAIRGLKPNGWELDYANPEIKQHVMCCLNPNHLLKETNLAKDLDPIWLDESFGWKGGSHDDAEEFCRRLGANKKLCPYAAYCPNGPGQPVIGGHSNDFNLEGEQWAPVHRESNYWVMIGQKYGNSATTCMDNWELEGKEPSWGTSNVRADLKKHIMCCEL